VTDRQTDREIDTTTYAKAAMLPNNNNNKCIGPRTGETYAGHVGRVITVCDCA